MNPRHLVSFRAACVFLGAGALGCASGGSDDDTTDDDIAATTPSGEMPMGTDTGAQPSATTPDPGPTMDPPPGNGGMPPVMGSGGTPPVMGSGGTPPVMGDGGEPPMGNGGEPPMGNGGEPPMGNGGEPPAGGGAGGTPPGMDVDCTIEVMASISDAISTVGIVEWSADLEGIDSAEIQFGLDTNYGLTAPVDLAEPNYRTLLLGMKSSNEYHARVVARAEAEECVGEDFTLTTGELPTGLPNIEYDVLDPDALAGGYIVTGTYQTGPAYILDADGDFVWWFDTSDIGDDPSGEITRARQSYDGKYMWIAKGNVPESMGAKVVRVRMDGSEPEDFTQDFQGQNHDFTVLEDETIYYIAYDGGCDKIVERSPDGSLRDVMNVRDAIGGGNCHCNAIHYSPDDDTIVVSELDSDSYVKMTRQGDVVWVLGGDASDFTGDGATWDRQHGFHLLGTESMFIFNNGPMNGVSLGLRIDLDLDGMTATRSWEYAPATDVENNTIMGDIQRLHNGNVMVTYSTQGVAHEVDEGGNLLQEIRWGLGGAIGYVMVQESLYGPPPK